VTKEFIVLAYVAIGAISIVQDVRESGRWQKIEEKSNGWYKS